MNATQIHIIINIAQNMKSAVKEKHRMLWRAQWRMSCSRLVALRYPSSEEETLNLRFHLFSEDIQTKCWRVGMREMMSRMTPKFPAWTAGYMEVPFTKMCKTEGKVLWRGRLYRDEEFNFDLIKFETSRKMSSWQLCIRSAEQNLSWRCGIGSCWHGDHLQNEVGRVESWGTLNCRVE